MGIKEIPRRRTRRVPRLRGSRSTGFLRDASLAVASVLVALGACRVARRRRRSNSSRHSVADAKTSHIRSQRKTGRRSTRTSDDHHAWQNKVYVFSLACRTKTRHSLV
jgi:hypothetical protein